MNQKNLSVTWCKRGAMPLVTYRISIGDKSSSCWFTNKGVLVGFHHWKLIFVEMTIYTFGVSDKKLKLFSLPKKISVRIKLTNIHESSCLSFS